MGNPFITPSAIRGIARGDYCYHRIRGLVTLRRTRRRLTAMTHRQRILADRIIAVPAAFLFNGVARVLGRLIRRDHTIKPSNIHRIVVAKLIGMGSILQATPLLKALKQQFPNAKVTFVTMRSNEELLKRLSCVDEVLAIDDRSVLKMAATTIETITALIRSQADLYFDLEVYSAFASLLALFAVTRNRLGFYRHSVAFKNGIYTHLVYFNSRMPVRRLYLQLGRVVGIPPGQSEVTGPIFVDDTARSGARRLLSESPGWQPEEPYIVVNPNASDLLLERRWPAEHVVEALERLVLQGYQVALVGNRAELPYVRTLFERLPPELQSRVVNTAGRLNLGEFLALLEGAACVLTNDTGPMHMAIALQRPTVCLFGPADPEHYGQNLDFVEIFYSRVFCSPCLYEADEPPCHGNNICMQRIPAEPVVQAVMRLAATGMQEEKARVRDPSPGLRVVSDGPDGTPLGLVVRASLHENRGNVMPECIACSTPMVRRFRETAPNHWRCPKCGLECLSPQPDDQTLAGIYNELYFSHYKTQMDPGIVRAMKRATYGLQFRRLPAPDSFGDKRRLLDCGAATGFLAELAREAGWDSFAIEISDFGTQACERLLGSGRVFRGEVQDAFFAANPEGAFEVITMFDFIEHVRDPKEVLRWARQRLHPGSVLLMTTPWAGSISWRLMGRQWFHYVREHLWFFNPESIRVLLRESGFASAEVHSLRKAVTVDYMLAHYSRSTSYSKLLSPVARALNSFLPNWIKRQRLWFYLGEMVVVARVGQPANSSGTGSDAEAPAIEKEETPLGAVK